MRNPVAEATAYIEKLEADRRAALEISDRKAMEAKLLASQEQGFRAAMDIFAAAIPVNFCEPKSEKSGHRRRRRDICELILRELSFSGHSMTTTQIAKAIEYIPERTETALKRLENDRKVVRNENGRWAAVITPSAKPTGHAAGAGPHKIFDPVEPRQPGKIKADTAEIVT